MYNVHLKFEEEEKALPIIHSYKVLVLERNKSTQLFSHGGAPPCLASYSFFQSFWFKGFCFFFFRILADIKFMIKANWITLHKVLLPELSYGSCLWVNWKINIGQIFFFIALNIG